MTETIAQTKPKANPERLAQWVEELRTTPNGQANGALRVEHGEAVTECCLGVGCRVAGLPAVRLKAIDLCVPEDDEGTREYLENHPDDIEHHTPLGEVHHPDDTVVGYSDANGMGMGDIVQHDEEGGSVATFFDLQPAAFNEWLGLPQGQLVLDIPAEDLAMRDSRIGHRDVALDRLNDDGMPFAHIADLITYFGVTVTNPRAVTFAGGTI